jgi:tRNA A37 threonylcarbamoyladenosine synthetase subunit TsaC/SUA5/YrdC
MAVLMKTEIFMTVTRLIYPFTWHNIPEYLSFHMFYRAFSQTVCRENQSLLATTTTKHSILLPIIDQGVANLYCQLQHTVNKQPAGILMNSPTNRQLISTVINNTDDQTLFRTAIITPANRQLIFTNVSVTANR